MAKYAPVTRLELIDLVKKVEDLGDIDTSAIDDMRFVFFRSDIKNFNGIETWDVSNVRNADFMFEHAERFNQPLDTWDLSSAKSIVFMFLGAKKFNQNLDDWRIHKVVDCRLAFAGSKTSPKWYN